MTMAEYKKWLWLGSPAALTPCNSQIPCVNAFGVICPGKVYGECCFEGESAEEDHIRAERPKSVRDNFIWVMVKVND
jgi:hypothetical protein